MEPKVIEETFIRHGEIYELRIGGRVIEVTPEHPLYVEGRGWTPAGEVVAGDVLSIHTLSTGRESRRASHLANVHSQETETSLATLNETQWQVVESNESTGRFETVYNFRVADNHTYFVGTPQWGFGVWVHNAGAAYVNDEAAEALSSVAKSGLKNSQRGLTTATEAHHPFFRMFLRSMDDAGIPGAKTPSGRFVGQGLAYLDDAEHSLLHARWNDYVDSLNMPFLKATPGNGSPLTTALKDGLSPTVIFDTMDDFLRKEAANGLDVSAAWLSMNNLRKRIGY